MKKIGLLFLLTGLSLGSFAQKLFFIYIQTDNNQAFFLRMNENVWSSSAQGYLILPKLHDSTYQFTIGFPQNKYPDQPFTVPMASKDHGFILKDFGAKGWGLFDLQTMAVIMNSGSGAFENKVRRLDSGATAFTKILAQAVDDPGLLEIPETPASEKADPVLVVNKPVETSPLISVQDTIARKELAAAEKKKRIQYLS